MVPSSAVLYQMVALPKSSERNRTLPNGAECCQAVLISLEGYQTVLNSAEHFQIEPALCGAEWYQTLPNCTERCQTVVNGAE